MKKKFILGAAVAAIALVSVFNLSYNTKGNLSSLVLANIEALADGDDDDVKNNINKCPSPYDGANRVLDFRQETKIVQASSDGSLVIGKWKGVGYEFNANYSCTYSIGHCNSECPDTCCDHTKIGEVKNVNPVKQ